MHISYDERKLSWLCLGRSSDKTCLVFRSYTHQVIVYIYVQYYLINNVSSNTTVVSAELIWTRRICALDPIKHSFTIGFVICWYYVFAIREKLACADGENNLWQGRSYSWHSSNCHTFLCSTVYEKGLILDALCISHKILSQFEDTSSVWGVRKTEGLGVGTLSMCMLCMFSC